MAVSSQPARLGESNWTQDNGCDPSAGERRPPDSRRVRAAVRSRCPGSGRPSWSKERFTCPHRSDTGGTATRIPGWLPGWEYETDTLGVEAGDNGSIRLDLDNDADYRGGVTCLYDTQLLGACLHASESGGRYSPWGRQGHARGTNRPPSHRAPGGVGGCRLCQPSLFQQGVVGAFAQGFGSLTSDFGVGKGQDRGC